MKILIYGLNYAPELTGVGKYTGEMALWLASQGHDVRVVTAVPYYPEWRVAPEYRRLRYRVESAEHKGEPRVYRCPLWVPRKPSGTNRILHLCSFAASSLPAMAIQAFWKPEIVLAIEPTFFIAPVALIAAIMTRAESWLHVQDLEVEAAFRSGMLRTEAAEKITRFLARFIIRGFSRVSTISDKMVLGVELRGVAPRKAFLFPNWSDVETLRSVEPSADNYFRKSLSLEHKTILLYSGNMGEKQELEVLAALAASFAHDSHIHFIFCGEGGARSNLQKLVARSKNVTMLPLQQTKLFNDLLNAADIHLLPQSRKVADLVMPSKLTGIFSSGRPVIATADRGTQLALTVEGRGLVVAPGDPEALQAAAHRLINSPALRAQLGQAARRYAVLKMSKEEILRSFEKELFTLVGQPQIVEKIELVRSYRG